MKNKTLWKSMRAGMLSGSGDIGPWKLNEWRTHPGELVMCESGFHASVRAIDAMRYVCCEVLALVEAKGKHLKQDDKQIWESMRVVKAYEWTKKDSVAMAIYCAELVIDKFEKKYPDDKRPRQAIEAAKTWLKDPSEENRKAASAYAASAAAYSAAYSAAYAAAYAASAAAAYAARAAYSASGAYAEKGTLDKVEAWITERVKTLKEIV